VAEADESDGSFLKLAPIIAVVTNIDREHLDHYASIEAIQAAFIEFVNKVPFYGAVIVCLDDANVQGILPAIKRRTVTYGATAQADVEASEIGYGPFASDFHLRYRTEDLGRFHLRVPGRHNVLNALAAVAVAMELEVPPDAIRRRWPRSAASTGGSRCAARSAASPSSTITATIPPRSGPRSRAPGCAASGASTCCFNHTGSRGRFT